MARPLGPVVRIDPPSGGDLRKRRRVSRRRQRRAARRRVLALAALCSCVLAAAALLVLSDHDAGNAGSTLQTMVIEPSRDADVARVSRSTEAKRLRYRYSVIPHGAYSAAELNEAIDADPVVARHYSTFDAVRASLVHLDRTRLAYVSYRLGDRVFWTRHPVRLPAGEAVLTDGHAVVRARCGNRISEFPGETSPDEPDPVLIDTPVDEPLPLLVADPAERALLLPLDPPTIDSVGGSVGPASESHRPDPDPPEEVLVAPRLVAPDVVLTGRRDVRSVPEPSSLLLLTGGLFGLGARMRHRWLVKGRQREDAARSTQ